MNLNVKLIKGQTLIELLVAIIIFTVAIASLAVLLLNTYISARLTREMSLADFLAKECLEAVRSIRDNNWADIVPGQYGLAIVAGHWVFSGSKEDISHLLKKGQRVVTIEDLNPPDLDRKRVICQVSWEFAPNRPQQITLSTYLTNFAKITPYLTQFRYRWRNDDGTE